MIKITLHKQAYEGWNGKQMPARVQVVTFDNRDRERAINWLIEDSYFGEEYTTKMVWEVDDQPCPESPAPRTRGA